mmetsp:Transcript_18101/g.30907  ORF Transcript_18101/g.30907 Transcript_18101/m.30907 type:complete len:95 (+) Transcript_18101:242-526(+)
MKTNLERNNNKYYILQIHQGISSCPSFQLYIRYGRVGEKGKQIVRDSMDLPSCIKMYSKLFTEKTSGGNPYSAIEKKLSTQNNLAGSSLLQSQS